MGMVEFDPRPVESKPLTQSTKILAAELDENISSGNFWGEHVTYTIISWHIVVFSINEENENVQYDVIADARATQRFWPQLLHTWETWNRTLQTFQRAYAEHVIYYRSPVCPHICLSHGRISENGWNNNPIPLVIAG